MKLLFVINIDMNKNGPSVHLLNDIINVAKNRGHTIIRIERKYNDDTWDIETESGKNEKRYTVETTEPRKCNYAKRYMNDLKYVSKCKKIAKKEKVDAIFLQSNVVAGFHLAWMKKRKDCQVLFNVQDIFPLDMYVDGSWGKHHPLYLIFSAIQNYAYKHSKYVVTISEDMKKSLLSLGVEENKLKVVHNWAYETEWIESDNQFVKNELYSEDKYYVVYAGNIGTAQDVETLIYAAKYLEKYEDIEILIIGKGARLEKCKEIVKNKMIDNVVFKDFLPQHLSQYIYGNASVNVVTLAPGIMNTSLPSKTAACYKSNRPVIYCVEDKAITVQKLIRANTMISQSNPGNAKQLAETILKVKSTNYSEVEARPFDEVLVPQKAAAYVDILESMK